MNIDERLAPGEPEPRVLIEKRFHNGCKWWDSVTISGVDEAEKLINTLNKINSLYVYRIKAN